MQRVVTVVFLMMMALAGGLTALARMIQSATEANCNADSPPVAPLRHVWRLKIGQWPLNAPITGQLRPLPGRKGWA